MSTRYLKGYCRGESNPRAKLTDRQVAQLRTLALVYGVGTSEAAAIFQITQRQARYLVSGTRRRLPGRPMSPEHESPPPVDDLPQD